MSLGVEGQAEKIMLHQVQHPDPGQSPQNTQHSREVSCWEGVHSPYNINPTISSCIPAQCPRDLGLGSSLET